MTAPEQGRQYDINETAVADMLGKMTPESIERMRLHRAPDDVPGVSPETAAAVLAVSRRNIALTREVIRRWDTLAAEDETALFAHPS